MKRKKYIRGESGVEGKKGTPWVNGTEKGRNI